MTGMIQKATTAVKMHLSEVSGVSGFQFGDANSSVKQPYFGNQQWAPSAYLNKSVFGAMLKGQNVGNVDRAFHLGDA